MILAIAAGALFSNGEIARLAVHHDGAPIPVQIVGLDAQNREIPIQAMPANFRAGKRPRTVRVQFPSNVTQLCAVYSSPFVRVLSCTAQLNLRQLNPNSSKVVSYLSTLRQALGAAPQKETAPLSLSLPLQTTE